MTDVVNKSSADESEEKQRTLVSVNKKHFASKIVGVDTNICTN